MMVSLPNKAMSCKLENPFVSEYLMFYCNVTELHQFKPRAKETFRIKLQSTLFLQLRFFFRHMQCIIIYLPQFYNIVNNQFVIKTFITSTVCKSLEVNHYTYFTLNYI